MSRNFKEFQRKVENRVYAIENSWRGTGDSKKEEPVETNAVGDWYHPQQLPWANLNENILEADACKYFDGYLPLESKRKWTLFLKKAIRKLIKIFLGWYIFPQYQRMSHFHGKVVNAISLERDILTQAIEQNQRIADKIGEQESSFNIQLREQASSFNTQLGEQASSFNTQLGEQASSFNTQLREQENTLRSMLKEHREFMNTLVERLEHQISKLTEENAVLQLQLKKIENLPTDDDEFYHAFEEKFRGSQDDIRDRLRVYVPKLKEHLQDWRQGTFVDVGSGRGEWLDILRENGASDYVGIDLNARQNALCAQRGHRVLQMDCIEYLASLPENTVDLITGFQIIEHLCMSDLMALLKESYRVLKKGGMILFETQNPRNLIVGADTFYIDPSHKRPMEPRMVAFLVEWCGYGQVDCIDANSYPNWMGVTVEPSSEDMKELIRQFNDLNYQLYGPQDYAVFGVKE